jgi:uncharacterized membrane protein
MTDVVTASAAVDLPATISLGQPGWLWPAVVLLVLALLALVWGYRRAGRIDAIRATAFVCKVAALALIAACLLEPLWSKPTPKPDANVVVVLADNSRGMSIAERVGGESRIAALRQLIGDGPTGWLPTLDASFDVRSYTFGDGVTRSVDLAKDLTAEGRASNLGAALKEVANRYRNRALAAVVVLSDGAATDLAGTLDTAGLPPVYTVPIGSDDIGADLAVSDVSVVTSNFEDAPVTVHADVRVSGLAGRQAVVRLQDVSGKLIEQQVIPIGSADHRSKVRFNMRPEKHGVVFYRVEVGVVDKPGSAPLVEATTANNRKTVVVDRGAGPYRILYVSGRPNWEYKFLHRAIEADDEVTLVGLIRIAKREPKFEFGGARPGDKANPLFTGVKRSGEEQSYDKPVLVRLSVTDQNELSDGFPISAEVLFAYHAIIIDDLEAGFFTRDQMELIQRYVSERGGGLLMLGGAESLDAGGYDRTPIGDLLPVYTRAGNQGSPIGGVRLELTREGLLQPWARLRDQADVEQQRLASLPRFTVINRTSTIKPGASLLATARTSSGDQIPALVAHRYGRGRALALTIGDTWRAGLSMDPKKSEDLARFWRQTVRWLIADVPGRISLSIDPATSTTRSTGLRARVLDAAFKPVDNSDAKITVAPPTGDPVILAGEPAAAAPGEFQAAYLAGEPGAYRITATATGPDGTALKPAEAGLVVDPDASEFATITPNRALLAQIAKQTGGRVLEPSALSGLANELLTREAPVMETTTSPLWHQAWVLGLIVALLIAEWILRRRRGMA